jgi:hypothetical protein
LVREAVVALLVVMVLVVVVVLVVVLVLVGRVVYACESR